MTPEPARQTEPPARRFAEAPELILPQGSLPLGARTLIMGVLNVTPDSFSDGGRFLEPQRAVDHALEMIEEGADLIDIGGESTRPGAEPVDPDEQCRRLLPVIEALARRTDRPISVDTRSAAVARRAVDAGAAIVNDVSALRDDPAMAKTVADTGAAVVLMHMQGAPETMQGNPAYGDVIAEVFAFLERAVAGAEAAGIERRKIIVDPGIGFGKTTGHNLAILAGLRAFRRIGRPLLVGPSRKRFLGEILDAPVDERVEGTAAAATMAVAGGADIVRVHDVAAICRAVRVADAIRHAGMER